jgi:hypothetical protein
LWSRRRLFHASAITAPGMDRHSWDYLPE